MLGWARRCLNSFRSSGGNEGTQLFFGTVHHKIRSSKIIKKIQLHALPAVTSCIELACRSKHCCRLSGFWNSGRSKRRMICFSQLNTTVLEAMQRRLRFQKHLSFQTACMRNGKPWNSCKNQCSTSKHVDSELAHM